METSKRHKAARLRKLKNIIFHTFIDWIDDLDADIIYDLQTRINAAGIDLTNLEYRAAR